MKHFFIVLAIVGGMSNALAAANNNPKLPMEFTYTLESRQTNQRTNKCGFNVGGEGEIQQGMTNCCPPLIKYYGLKDTTTQITLDIYDSEPAIIWTGTLSDHAVSRYDRTNCIETCVSRTGDFSATDQPGEPSELNMAGTLNCDGWTIISDDGSGPPWTNYLTDVHTAYAVNSLHLYFKYGFSCSDGYCGHYWWGNYGFTQTSCSAGAGSSALSFDSNWSWPAYTDGNFDHTVTYGDEFTTPQLIGLVQCSPSGEWIPTGGKSYVASAAIDEDESAATVNAVEARFKVWAHKGEEFTIPYTAYRTVFSNGQPIVTAIETNISGVGNDDFQYLYVPLPAAFSTYETNGCTFYRGEQSWIESGGCSGGGGCSTCTKYPGTTDTDNKSIHITFGLGGVAYGEGNAFLKIISARPDPVITTPASLELFGDLRGAVVVRDGNGAIQQVKTPLCLADVTTNSPTSFTIKFYVAAPFYGSGPFDTGGATAYATNTVEQVGSTNHIHVKVENGTTTESDYVWSDSDNGWTLTTGGGLRKETRTVSESPRIRTHTIKNAGDAIVFQEVSRYVTLGTNYYLSQRETGAPGSGLTNKWFYYDNAGTDGPSYGKIKLIIEPSGFWKRYQYDDQGRLTNEVSQFQNAATNAAENLCRVVRYDYTSLDGTNEFETRVELVQGIEIARDYTVVLPGETQHIRCTTAGAAWTDSANLVTRTRLYGAGEFVGKTQRVMAPDGTMRIYQYENSSGLRTTTVYSGQPNLDSTAVVRGTKTVTVTYEDGRQNYEYSYDLDEPSYFYAGGWNEPDTLGRLHRTHSVDNTDTYYNYDCCGLESIVAPDGVTTINLRDSLHRQTGSLRNGVTTTNLLDAVGNVLVTKRVGTDNSVQVLRQANYDTAGRLVNETNALTGVTSYAYAFDGSGQTVKTTTYPDGGQRVETYYQDGSLRSVTGSAAFPVYYDYGATNNTTWTKETKGNSSGSEWVKSYNDLLGRSWKTEYSDGAASTNFYNIKGQLEKSVDPDGVIRLYTYNSLGQTDKTILDMDRNGVGTDAVDRTTRSTNDVVVLDEYFQRSRTYQTRDDGSEILIQERLTTPYHKTLDLSFGLGTTNEIIYLPYDQQRTVTTKHPDNSRTVALYTNGLLAQVQRQAPGGWPIISQTDYAYDAHGRQRQIIDARTGTTTYTYNAADLVQTVTTPSPDGVASGLVTTTYYDKSLRATNVIQPDATSTKSVYFANGLLQKTWGSRIYPVEYQYDFAGRMTNMLTWQDFNETTGAGTSGSAATKWLYDTSRGWLNQKKYADNTGPSYTYTPAGRLKSRAWVRGVTTWYTNNNAGDLWVVNYTDTTPDVTNSYDRRGRLTNILSGTTSLTKLYNDAGILLSEVYSGGPLSGVAVTNRYDGLLRRTNVTLLKASSVLTSTGYAYDENSRLLMVADGTNSATYDYLDNSSLVEQIAFATNGMIVMTTTKAYDYLNRLTNIVSLTNSAAVASFSYQYNTANQRTSVTNGDGSYWVYSYDSMGQVTSGKKYWSDNSPVAGQQFDYTFDDIGNRKATTRDTRSAAYTPNTLNQYTSRTVPGYVNVLGTATNTATVSLWSKESTTLFTATTRKGDYFRGEMPFNNATAAMWLTITNVAALSNSASADIVTNVVGGMLLAKNLETFTYDLDGNLTSDSLWTNTWNGENRRITIENQGPLSASGKVKEDWMILADGRWIERIVSTNNGTSYYPALTNRYVWDGQILLAVLDHTNGVVVSFLRGLDLSGSLQGAGGVGGVLAVRAGNSAQCGTLANTTHFTCYDGNGNVSALVNAATGAESARYERGPFAERVRETGPMAKLNPIRFSTQYHDDYTGDDKYVFRDLSDGRWPTRDPINELGFKLLARSGGGFNRSEEENLFRFVSNNPINGFDPDGRSLMFPTGDLLAGAAETCCNLLSGRRTRNQAVERGVRIGDTTYGGNAYLHCVAACRANKACTGAKRFWDGRETPGTLDGDMDLANNAVGYGIQGDCWQGCADAWRNGSLTCIDVHGQLSPCRGNLPPGL